MVRRSYSYFARFKHIDAFGATDKAFRHGDIENILETLAKTAGKASIGGSGILGLAASVYQAAAGPPKFSKSDIKKVYFVRSRMSFEQCAFV